MCGVNCNLLCFVGKRHLDNGDMQESSSETNDNGSSSHDSWTCKESHSHGEGCNGIPTCYHLRLQSHEQSCDPKTSFIFCQLIYRRKSNGMNESSSSTPPDTAGTVGENHELNFCFSLYFVAKMFFYKKN